VSGLSPGALRGKTKVWCGVVGEPDFKCPGCGQAVHSTDASCANCGAAVASAGLAVAPQAKPAPPPPPPHHGPDSGAEEQFVPVRVPDLLHRTSRLATPLADT